MDSEVTVSLNNQPQNKFKLPSTMNTAKFIDDATCQELIDLNTALATNIDRSGPLPYWEKSTPTSKLTTPN